MLPLLQLLYASVRYSVTRKLTIESVVFVSVAGVVLPLQPLLPVVIVCDFVCSSLPLLCCVIYLTDVSVLVFLHAFSANGHVN